MHGRRLKTGLYRENGHVDFVQFDGKIVCCSWCGDEPTHRALWPGYQYGELVCLEHAEKLARYGARVQRRHVLSSIEAGKTTA